MITIYAAQHFFSSVPAEQSPARKRGYQTILRTPALSPEVVRLIEDRCLYGGGEGDPLKWQFYALPNHLFAVSQTVALAERDEFGRKGRYLAHTLVLDLNAFAQLEFCPVDLLSQFPFLRRLEDVFAQSQSGSLDVKPVQVQVNPGWRSLAQRARSLWDVEALKQLGRLAWQAQPLTKEQVSTAVNGSDQDMLALLALEFALAGPQHRALLSFDTWAQGCDWGPGVYFWMQRYAAGEKGRLTQFVDAAAHRTAGIGLSGERSPYGQWAEQDGILANLETASTEQQWAVGLEAVLLNRAAQERARIRTSEAFMQRFAQINAQEVARAWGEHLPAGLSPELGSRLKSAVAAYPAPYLTILASGLTADDMNVFLYQQLYQLQSAPTRGDRAALEKYIHGVGDRMLNTLLALWAKKGKDWAKALEQVDEEDYRFAMTSLALWAEPPLPLWEGIVPGCLDIWLKAAVPSIQGKQWQAALDRLSELGDPALDRLATFAALVQPDSRIEIGQWLVEYKGRADALRRMFPAPARKKFLGFI